VKINSIKTLLEAAIEQLLPTSDSAKLDAELLLAHCLGKNRSYLYAWSDKKIDDVTSQRFTQLIKRRLTDYPVAYLLGNQGFWSLDLKVTEDVLIPRSETELLVEVALEKISKLKSPTILDLGTGSGAIALALAQERPDALVIASDYSKKALAVAKENAQLNHIKNVNFIHSSWFENIEAQSFDLIVSNPPYIPADDPHLSQGIRYEPLQALSSGKTGLNDIRLILQMALTYMQDTTWILIEHGYDQGEAVPKLMQKAGLQQVLCIKDYNENDRLSIGTKG